VRFDSGITVGMWKTSAMHSVFRRQSAIAGAASSTNLGLLTSCCGSDILSDQRKNVGPDDIPPVNDIDHYHQIPAPLQASSWAGQPRSDPSWSSSDQSTPRRRPTLPLLGEGAGDSGKAPVAHRSRGWLPPSCSAV
jgi:hypothetical protein